MASEEFEELLENVESSIDSLESALEPLLDNNLSTITSKLPLLDKAKLDVLVIYAIDSLLFSSLKLNGVDVKDHPVYRELTRVRQYFEKIKDAEADHIKGPAAALQPKARLDKAAAGRFVKHALSKNEQHDREHAESLYKENAAAKYKFNKLNERYGSSQRFRSVGERNETPSNISDASSVADSTPGTPGGEAQASSSGDRGSGQKRKLSKEETRAHKEEKRAKNEDNSKRHKSSNPPKASKDVLKDLLSRSDKQTSGSDQKAV